MALLIMTCLSQVHPLLPSLHLTPAVVRRVQSRLLSLFGTCNDAPPTDIPMWSDCKPPVSSRYDNDRLRFAALAPIYPHSDNIIATFPEKRRRQKVNKK